MTQTGIGAMLHALSGGGATNGEAVKAAAGKRVISAELDGDRREDGAVVIGFEEGELILWDNARSCCESRYIDTDDDLEDLVGGVLVGVAAQDGPTAEDAEGVHEQDFLHIKTDKATVVLCTHNEHNGYYGGIALCAAWEPKE